ncbi:protein AGENET DOMAIN (AGD)-CONTAINING P1-like [Lotus japonicus]|uniref:protein AGENET DOMAIN (AGD)-CONTAINING P1-like n=1 Tax=Lotus japonicus TaxID=34305 RepID=UPI002583E564|nr:protein AGENET DOMAIN (AGD)-CONTAINING P1-like [Lotus japonicus]
MEVPPPPPQMEVPPPPVIYNIGDQVEVIGHEDGFFDSYFEATVVSLLDGGRYWVEYETLVEDDETGIPLKEAILPTNLRPAPPRVNVRGEYKLDQMVNVFYNDGWWYGRVNGKILGYHAKGYTVHFSTYNETLPFHCSCMRVHHDFIDGEWHRV